MTRPTMCLVSLFSLMLPVSLASADGKTREARVLGVFEDVTTKVGVHFQQISGTEGKNYIVETVGGGVALFDYDRDGWLDLYLTSGSTLEAVDKGRIQCQDRLYRNRGDGTFVDVTARAGITTPIWGMGVAVADYDNDGYPDIFVTGYRKTILYRNNRDGTFEDVTERAHLSVPSWSTGAAWSDYDRDGDLDLYVARYVDFDKSKVSIKRGSELCQYRGLAVMCGPRGLPGASDLLFRNNGDGTFTDVTVQALGPDIPSYYGFTPVWADFDDDGWPDLYVANDGTPSLFYRNRGNGTFHEIGLMAGCSLSADGRQQAGMGADFGDYDGDGKLDLFKTNFSDDYNNLYRNLGNAEFEDVSSQTGLVAPSWPHLGWAAKFVDFNLDGRLDLFVVNGHVYPEVEQAKMDSGYRQPTQVFMNVPSGFLDVSAEMGIGASCPRSGRGAAFGDIDNDGDVDVVLNNLDSDATVLANHSPPARWLVLRLEGTKSNREALGARITIRVNGKQQVREVNRCGGFLSSNDVRAYFGLGSAQSVEELEVKWPSGLRQTFSSVQANHRYRIVEGGSGPVLDE